ncbi:flagellar motor switch protein FliN [Nitratireductor sp. XY-223]|uniref:flagellar motor switch protein FliN n=1 Tax=Nitratireductor sp. XY-223 TaxID=2561926 RepID=UPI001FEF82E7|nr:flagellar motor switch protein FliN [Nitratireductor sp. XY-223]
MSDNKAMKEDEAPVEEPEAELDQAIDDLRGVLEKDAAGTLNPGNEDENPFGADSLSMDDFPETANTDTDPLADAGDFGADFSAQPEAADIGQPTGATGNIPNADIIMDIPVDVQIVLGKTRMKVSSLMSLDEGATISLDRKIGETVDIMVNGRMIGHGEITVLEEDETRFGVRLTEILGSTK